MLSCCESESILNCICLIILSFIAYHCDTYAHVNTASISYVGMSFLILIIKQHLHSEIAIWKFFNNGYPGVSCPPPWELPPIPENLANSIQNDFFFFFYDKFISHNYQNSSNVCFSLFFSLWEEVGAKIL